MFYNNNLENWIRDRVDNRKLIPAASLYLSYRKLLHYLRIITANE